MHTISRATALAVVLAIAIPTVVLGATPSNDSVDQPTVIASLPFGQPFDLADATDDPATPACEASVSHRIWYRYAAPSDQTVLLSVGHDPRAELALWASDGAGQGVTLSKCAIDGSDLAATLTGGNTYLFSIGQYFPASPPWLSGAMSLDVVLPPVNDDFAHAAVIANGDSIGVSTATSLAASRELGEPVASCDEDGFETNTLWYRFTVSGPARATVTTDLGGFAAMFSGASLTTLTELACSPELGATADLTTGTYYIQLSGRAFRPQGITLRLDLQLPPANDAFNDAISIGSVPYRLDGMDLTLASLEAGEPTACAGGYSATAWWTFKAQAAGRLTVSGFGLPVGLWSGADLGSLTSLGCAAGDRASIFLSKGQLVRIQLAGPNAGSSFGLTADFAKAAANDTFSHAVALGQLPIDLDVDASTASTESGEPTPSCYPTPVSTVWYGFKATGVSTSFSFEPGYRQAAVAAYTGAAVDQLTQIGCASPWSNTVFTIKPKAGTKVWVQVAMSDNEGNRQLTLHGFATPPPVVDFTPGVNQPTVFVDIPFYDGTNDPGGTTHTQKWAFGDGSTSTDPNPVHRYAKDGDYKVTLSVVTADGRKGTATKTVSVRTHDVAITKLSVPSSARSGQTKTVTVSIGNRRYPETATVQLMAIAPGGTWQVVGQTTSVSLPLTRGGPATEVAFAYTFTAEDARAGKVTFKASVILDIVFDAAPVDNELSAPPTRVTR